MPDAHYVLWIACADQKGLVHKVTGALFKRDLNIIENVESVDRLSDTFFMRTEFVGSFNEAEFLAEVRGFIPTDSQLRLNLKKPKKLLLLATRESHCLGDLLLRHSAGELNATVEGVVSQYDDLRQLTERFEIPYHCIPVAGDDRAAHERAVLAVCKQYSPDYLVLAKYMRILSAEFIAGFDQRIINIHHSFLPAFIGASPYRQAYERGVKIIGATAHFVTQDLDEGPIITQQVTGVDHSHGPVEMARAGRDVERTVLAQALALVLEDRVLIHGRRTVVFG